MRDRGNVHKQSAVAYDPLGPAERSLVMTGYEVYRLTPLGLVRVSSNYKSSLGGCFTMLAISKDVVAKRNGRDLAACIERAAELGDIDPDAP